MAGSRFTGAGEPPPTTGHAGKSSIILPALPRRRPTPVTSIGMTSSTSLGKSLSPLIPLLAIGTVASWFLAGLPVPLRVTAPLSLAVLSLLVSKTYCAAPRRDGKPCEENTYGVFRACHRHAHQEAKARMLGSVEYWQGLALARYSGWKGALAVYLTAVGLLAGLAAALSG